MLISAEKTGTNEFTVQLSISAEDFEKAVNTAYHREKGKINVPGFRKGKAPRAFIEKIYGTNVFYDDALEIAFPDAYEKAVEEAGISTVDNPFDFDIKSMGAEGAELVCKVTVKPEIEIDGYKGIKAVKPSYEVTDAEVEAEFGKKLEDNARMISVEDRAVENGDITVIDFEGFVDEKAFDGGKAEDYELEIGSGSFIPGFEEQIIGHAIDDEFDVNVTFPEEYAAELAGKEAVFKIKLHSIRKKELPAADDEFAKDVSEFDTLDEYKADLRKTLENTKKSSADRTFENSVFDSLASLVTAEIPEAMVAKTTDNMMSEFKYNVESQGIPFETYLQYLGMTPDSFRETYKDRAEKEVRIELALEKIAELEGCEVTDEEVNAELAKLAETYGVDVDTISKAIDPEAVKKDLKARKASAIVTENAVAEAPEEEPAKKAKKKPAAKKTAAKKPAAKKTAEESADEEVSADKTAE